LLKKENVRFIRSSITNLPFLLELFRGVDYIFHQVALLSVPRSRVLQDKPPIIYGDGEQSRDFTFIKDVIKANIIGAGSDACGVFNIGGGENSTVNDLAKTIITLTGKDLHPEYQQPRPGDIKHSLADISRARAIGCDPEYNLDNGLREIIERLTSAS